MEVQVSSETPVGRIVVLGLESKLFGDADPTEIMILMDGEEISFSDLESLLEGSGSEPVYYLSVVNGTYELVVYIPETTTHSITAQLKEDKDPDFGWVWILLGILLIVVIVIVLAVSLLTAAQKKRKMEAYFEDFEIGMKEDDRVVKGDLEDKEWEDMLE
jgi:hypothetical protein